MFPFTDAARGGRAPVGGGTPGRAAPFDGGPALRDAAGRALARLVKGLQAMAGASTIVEGAVAGITSATAAAVVASHRPEGAAALLDGPALGCPMVATLDATMVHALVELLCGGDGGEPPGAGRPATSIDRQFAQIAFNLLAGAIQAEWSSFGFGTIKATRVEAGLAADVFGPRASGIAVIDLSAGVLGLHGTLRLALPPEALGRFRDAGRDAGPAVAASDPVWSDLLAREIGRARVGLAAYLDAKPLTLGALSALKVGQILAMPGDARTRAALVGDGRILYRGEIGQAEGRYSLRVDEIVPDAARPEAWPPSPRAAAAPPARAPPHQDIEA